MAAEKIVGLIQGLGPGEVGGGPLQARRRLDGPEPQGQAPQIRSQRHLWPEGLEEVLQPALEGLQGQRFPGRGAGRKLGQALPLPQLLRQPLLRHQHQGPGAGFGQEIIL